MPPRTEVAVIGLGLSGQAVATLLARDGAYVYASDAGDGEGVRRAAAELAAAGVAVDVGRHDLARIAQAARMVVSPGVPPDAPAIVAGRAAGVPVVSEIEIALAHLRGVRYIAVTGTNGKTTTTALVAHLLRALGYDAVDAGNIGLPLSAVALRDRLPQWVALELSSFQLHETPSVDPNVGVLTNLSPDHLDRYPTAEAYYADKALLFANARPDSVTVANADDPAARAMGAHGPGITSRSRSKVDLRTQGSSARRNGSTCLALRCSPEATSRCWATTTSRTRSRPHWPLPLPMRPIRAMTRGAVDRRIDDLSAAAAPAAAGR